MRCQPSVSARRRGGTSFVAARAYLQLLAADNGLSFHRLLEQQALAEALQAPALARPLLTRVDLRVALASIALALLVSLWLPRRIGRPGAPRRAL